eukprot:scaffold65284_cov20-Tisochrysis_lutea.AAC.1
MPLRISATVCLPACSEKRTLSSLKECNTSKSGSTKQGALAALGECRFPALYFSIFNLLRFTGEHQLRGSSNGHCMLHRGRVRGGRKSSFWFSLVFMTTVALKHQRSVDSWVFACRSSLQPSMLIAHFTFLKFQGKKGLVAPAGTCKNEQYGGCENQMNKKSLITGCRMIPNLYSSIKGVSNHSLTAPGNAFLSMWRQELEYVWRSRAALPSYVVKHAVYKAVRHAGRLMCMYVCFVGRKRMQ